MADPITYTFQVEIEREKLVAMMKSYSIPVTDENIEDFMDRMQDLVDEDLDMDLDNTASYMADDLGIEPPSD
jgi:hypothetical protein